MQFPSADCLASASRSATGRHVRAKPVPTLAASSGTPTHTGPKLRCTRPRPIQVHLHCVRVKAVGPSDIGYLLSNRIFRKCAPLSLCRKAFIFLSSTNFISADTSQHHGVHSRPRNGFSTAGKLQFCSRCYRSLGSPSWQLAGDALGIARRILHADHDFQILLSPVSSNCSSTRAIGCQGRGHDDHGPPKSACMVSMHVFVYMNAN